MTVSNLDGIIFTGLQSDTKPTAANAASGALFFETDTGVVWVNQAGTWTVMSTMAQTISERPADASGVTSSSNKAAGLAVMPGSSDLAGATVAGATTAVLDSAASFYAGEHVLIEGGTATAEIAIIKSINSATLTFVYPLTNAHADEGTVKGVLGITPRTTGKLRIRIVGVMTGANGDTCQAQIIIGSAITAAPPANGGTIDASAVAVGNIAQWIALTGALGSPFECIATLGSNPYMTDSQAGAARTVGTPYYVDLAVNASAGANTVTKLAVFIDEI